jgi:bifunctional ADP-heptose synthase (sugar kinase/adenylyltransferase)
LATREYSLETRDSNLPAEDQVRHVARKLKCPRLMMTQGRYGTLAYGETDGFSRVPALATQVIDRVGAGDAVLCVTSLCVAQGAPPVIAGFIGNVVGAEAVAILGNQRSIERIPLYRHIECLLKMHHTEPDKEAKENIKFAA